MSFYIQPPVTDYDRSYIQFDNLQEDAVLNLTLSDGVRIEHDVEELDKDCFNIHIDVWFTQTGKGRLIIRTVFTIEAPFEEVWREDIVSYYIRTALDICYEVFNDECTDEDIDYKLSEHFKGPEMVEKCSRLLIKDVAANRLFIDRENDEYKWNTVAMPNDEETIMVASVTLAVLDEIFLTNPAFNRTANIENFNNYLPFRFYHTVKIKLEALIEGRQTHLSLRQLIIYLLMVRCSCTLMISDHYAVMQSRLEARGLTEENFKQYLAYASSFLHQIDSQLASMDVKIINLEEDIDWAAVVG